MSTMNTSPLIRMSTLHPSELPSHPLLSSTDSEDIKRPDLLPWILTLLNQASAVLNPIGFTNTFRSHSHRPAPPSNTDVESLVANIPSATLIEKVKWSDPDLTAGVGRTKPRDIPTEHWFARRSYHKNVSSKVNPATASWEEFVFGLRDNHSKNEEEFTPTLYDARHILDWNEELKVMEQKWRVGDNADTPSRVNYSNMTLAVYEMCHEVPFPLQPRCFAVVVATASVHAKQFIAVTIPVNLGSFPGAFYSNGRNQREGEDSLRKKPVVCGVYTAVEKCELITKPKDKNSGAVNDGTAVEAETEEWIEWIMATASDAKGNLPMMFQTPTMPGMVVKDVGYFLKWISGVDEKVIKGEQRYESKRASDESLRKGRSRGGSSASREMLSSARSSIEKAVSLAPP